MADIAWLNYGTYNIQQIRYKTTSNIRIMDKLTKRLILLILVSMVAIALAIIGLQMVISNTFAISKELGLIVIGLLLMKLGLVIITIYKNYDDKQSVV